MYQVIQWPEVAVELARILGGNQLAIHAVNRRLEYALGLHGDRHRKRRDPDDPDFLFDYPLYFCDGENWITMRFSVNDTTAAGYLFVVAVSCAVGKVRL